MQFPDESPVSSRNISVMRLSNDTTKPQSDPRFSNAWEQNKFGKLTP